MEPCWEPQNDLPSVGLDHRRVDLPIYTRAPWAVATDLFDEVVDVLANERRRSIAHLYGDVGKSPLPCFEVPGIPFVVSPISVNDSTVDVLIPLTLGLAQLGLDFLNDFRVGGGRYKGLRGEVCTNS